MRRGTQCRRSAAELVSQGRGPPHGGELRQAAGAAAAVVEGLVLTLAWPLVRSAAIIASVPLVRSVAIIDPCPRRAASHRPFEACIGALHGVGCNLVC